MIRKYLEKSIAVKNSALSDHNFLQTAEKAGEAILTALTTGKRIYIAGNGGSAADAQHFATELIGKYKSMRKAFPVIALTTDTSLLTAWANDVSFDSVFARQLEGLGQEGDIFLAISTSGESSNITEALKTAKSLGMVTIGLLGKGGGKSKELCDIAVVVPSDTTSHIQELHITLIHYFCELVESENLSH